MLTLDNVLFTFPTWQGTAEPDSYRDFLGVRTRVKYLPDVYREFAGKVEGQPSGDRAGICHDPLEWAGVLKAVVDAKHQFVCMELGAGWGPIVVGAGKAAQARGIENLHLVAVEASIGHVEFMRQHFLDNGFRPDDHRLMTAAVGTYDGVARFPKLGDPSVEWGGEASYVNGQGGGNRTPQLSEQLEEVPCISLRTLVLDIPSVDVIHFDIQGAEADVIESCIDDLNRRVRRIVIGTHGRDIEQRLLKMLDGQGWTLEADKASRFQQPVGQAITLYQDGVQVWSNPRL